MHDMKSTASGILTGLIATFGGLLSYQVPMALMNPTMTHTWLYIVMGCQVGTIVAKAWLGAITNNANASAVAAAINNAAQAGPTAAPVSTAELTIPVKES